MTKKRTSLVIGVGAEQGLGAALCRRFASEGFHVYAVGRTLSKLKQVVKAIEGQGGSAEAIQTDVSSESEIVALFNYVCSESSRYLTPELVVFNVGNNRRIDFLSLTVEEIEEFWRSGSLAGFIVGREAIRHMLPDNKGTVIFTGASSSLRGKPGYAHFSAAKAGLRMLSQSMAREFGPAGIHIAHVIVDGGIDGELMKVAEPQRYDKMGTNALLIPDEISEVFLFLHHQPRSAWTQEIDLRPSQEPF